MFSVILPVYNVEKYLRQCLDSLINQSYKDLEIICVNDCSPDGSLRILEEYAQKDSRIKIINQEKNQGQGVARNIGIQIAKGEYISFVDPDDWVELNMFEELHQAIINYNYPKLLQFDIYEQFDGSDIARKYDFAKKMKLHLHFDLAKAQRYNLKTFNGKLFLNYWPPCWNKVYSREFLLKNDICFSEERYGEDCAFTYPAILKGEDIYYLPEYFYYYRKRNGAVSSGIEGNNFKTFEYLNIINKRIIENNLQKSLGDDFSNYKIRELFYCYNAVSELYKAEYIEYSKKYLNEEEFQKFKKIVDKSELKKKIFYVSKTVKNGKKIRTFHILGKKFTLGKK